MTDLETAARALLDEWTKNRHRDQLMERMDELHEALAAAKAATAERAEPYGYVVEWVGDHNGIHKGDYIFPSEEEAKFGMPGCKPEDPPAGLTARIVPVYRHPPTPTSPTPGEKGE